MEQARYNEMTNNLKKIKDNLLGQSIFLFGHCEATLLLADMLLDDDIRPRAILDNNKNKQGISYKSIPVTAPIEATNCKDENAIVLIATRFYESMNVQLRELGFCGSIVKLVDYNSYAEYSLSEETRNRKKKRIEHGIMSFEKLKDKYPEAMIIFCPFNALGDVYYCLSYLPEFLKHRELCKFVLVVSSRSSANVAELFGTENIEIYDQNELDAMIQAVIFLKDELGFIAHQDRPYAINLHKALSIKRIPLEKIYCCGIFGLPQNTAVSEPSNWEKWDELSVIKKGKAVILAPYAKSVIALPDGIWEEIANDYLEKGYQVFTNVFGEEIPIAGTKGISAKITEMKSIVERAGTFIGIRSGLCDILKTAYCKKIALYPDYNYSDTIWKAIEMYYLDEYENIVVGEDFKWEMN